MHVLIGDDGGSYKDDDGSEHQLSEHFYQLPPPAAHQQ